MFEGDNKDQTLYDVMRVSDDDLSGSFSRETNSIREPRNAPEAGRDRGHTTAAPGPYRHDAEPSKPHRWWKSWRDVDRSFYKPPVLDEKKAVKGLVVKGERSLTRRPGGGFGRLLLGRINLRSEKRSSDLPKAA
jgi:hypothetical protein